MHNMFSKTVIKTILKKLKVDSIHFFNNDYFLVEFNDDKEVLNYIKNNNLKFNEEEHNYDNVSTILSKFDESNKIFIAIIRFSKFENPADNGYKIFISNYIKFLIFSLSVHYKNKEQIQHGFTITTEGSGLLLNAYSKEDIENIEKELLSEGLFNFHEEYKLL